LTSSRIFHTSTGLRAAALVGRLRGANAGLTSARHRPPWPAPVERRDRRPMNWVERRLASVSVG